MLVDFNDSGVDCHSTGTVLRKVLAAFLMVLLLLQYLLFLPISSELNPFASGCFDSYMNNSELTLVLIKTLVMAIHIIWPKVDQVYRG